MSLTLKIQIVRTNQLKAMKFVPTMSVSEACATIFEKTNEGNEDHGLFQPASEGRLRAIWLRMERTLQYYDLKINDTLEYKKRHRPLKVKFLDDTVKTMIVDDSMSVEQLVEVIGKKMNIKHFELFSLRTENSEGVWLDGRQSLPEQGVTEEQLVGLKMKFCCPSDYCISHDDPVQLHLEYDEIIQFAALQSQIQLGSYNPAIHKLGFFKNKEEYLPPYAQNNKGAEKDITNEYRKLVGTSEGNAKYRYVQLYRSSKTYGVTFFKTKERVKGTKKMVPKLLGITRDAILRLDSETKEVEHEYPLVLLSRWAVSPASFTLDFGDYEEEYCSVVTNEGETISQIIAGYIDILKKQKETGATLDLYSSTSTGILHSMARKGLQITNVDTAQTAIANLINELGAPHLPVPGTVSDLSPQQWRRQLLISSKGVAAAAGKLGALGVQPQNMDHAALNIAAKGLVITLDNMLQSARNATASEKEDHDGAMPLLDSAKAVAEAVAKMLKVIKDLSNNPTGVKSKEAFKNANEAFAARMSLLNVALYGQLADVAASRLIVESARAVAVASNDLLSYTKDVAEALELDAVGQQKLLEIAQAAQNGSQNCLAITQTLAPAVLDPSCKRMIIDSAKSVQLINEQLLACYQNIGTDLEGVWLVDAARTVNEAIAQLMGSTEVAEPRSGADQDFSDAAKVITETASKGCLLVVLAILEGAQGDALVIQHSGKAIAEAMPLLIAGAKRAARRMDPKESNKLLQCAKQVSDEVKDLTGLAAEYANAPGDQVAFARLQEASQRVAHLTHHLFGDPGKEAALQALRASAKQGAAATTGLVAAARTAATSYKPEVDFPPLLAAAKLAADVIAKLIKHLQEAKKATEASPEQIANLLNAAERVASAGYKLVDASKQAAQHIASQAKEEDLVFAANLASETLKQLAASTAGVQGAATGDTISLKPGRKELDAAIEAIQTAAVELDAAALNAAIGLLENTAPPCVRLHRVQEDLVEVAKDLANSVKEVVTSAKSSPEKLGAAAKATGTGMRKLTNISKQCAGLTIDTAVQQEYLSTALAYYLLEMLTAAKNENMNELPTQARNATKAIDAIIGITNISANTNHRTRSLPS